MKRLLFRLFLGSMAMFAISSFTAFAVSTYTIDTTTFTAGTDPGTVEIEYTADTVNQTWADGDTLIITLPDPFPDWSDITFTAEYDEDTDNDGNDETDITAGVGNGDYSISGKALTVKWDVSTWGAVITQNSTIRVIITADATPTYGITDDTLDLAFSGSTANGGDANPGGSNPALTFNPADAAASVAISPATVGAVTAVVTFTIPSDAVADDYMEFSFPSNFDISGATYSSDTFAGDGEISCLTSGQLLHCTTDDALTAATGTVTVTGINVLYPGNSQTITDFVFQYNDEDAQRSTDSSVSITDINSNTGGGGVSCGTGLVPNSDGTACVAQSTGDDDDDSGEEVSNQGDDDDDDSGEVTGDDDDDDDSVGEEEEAGEEEESEEETEVWFSDIAGHWAEEVIIAMAEDGYVKGNPNGTFEPDANLNRASAAALVYRILGFSEDADQPTTAPFSDVQLGLWFTLYVSTLKDIGVVGGVTPTSYEPSRDVTRAEFLQMALKGYMYTLSSDDKAEVQAMIDGDVTTAFADLEADAWYSGVVTAAYQLGMIEGRECEGGKCAAGDEKLTRAEATKILYNFFVADDEESGDDDDDAEAGE